MQFGYWRHIIAILGTCFLSSCLEIKEFAEDTLSHAKRMLGFNEDKPEVREKPKTYIYSFGEHSSLDSIIPSVSALNRIPIDVKPSKIKYNLYYRMRLPDDFDVTVRYVWREDWKNIEGGVKNIVVANFRDCRTGKDYLYKDTHWGFSKGSGVLPGGENEKDGDVHYFNYEWPEEPYTIYDRAAFQFMDVDFDGTKELLASEGDFSREGNAQRIYRLKGKRVVPADDLPFSCVRALTTKFDAEKKTVIERADSIFEYKRLGHKLKLVRVYPINRK